MANLEPPPGPSVPLSLYVHIPWCVRKCPYCDFNSHAARGTLPEDAYIDALLLDLDADLPAAFGRGLESVFIGGGTPSLFSPKSIARLLAAVRTRLPLRSDAEITLEANPGTVDQSKLAAFRDAGVNRLSIGVQSFNASQLSRLGRIHDPAQALAAAESARDAGFDNFNLDIMFGLPGQSLSQAVNDISQAIALGPSHISHYQLTLEPNTLFHRYPPALPHEDLIWAMQAHCQEHLARAGYRQYEVSAYARPGRQCQHNLNYWEFGDYLAIGAGAHDKRTHSATGKVSRCWKQKNPHSYLEHAGSARCIGNTRHLLPGDLRLEFMINALRLREGFSKGLFRARTGLDLEHLQGPLGEALARGLLVQSADQIRASARGWRFLNDLLEFFLPEQNPCKTKSSRESFQP